MGGPVMSLCILDESEYVNTTKFQNSPDSPVNKWKFKLLTTYVVLVMSQKPVH